MIIIIIIKLILKKECGTVDCGLDSVWYNLIERILLKWFLKECDCGLDSRLYKREIKLKCILESDYKVVDWIIDTINENIILKWILEAECETGGFLRLKTGSSCGIFKHNF
jgi:hypothetical protein